jgi:hypothetical protein
MPIDAYSLCPGGTGKRVKFCCKDILTDLQDIERMQQGDQHLACLERIEQVEHKAPDRACLQEIKCQLLLSMERVDDYRATVTRFVEKHPDNPVAWAERAILASHDEGPQAAMAALQQATAVSGEGISGRVYDAMGAVAHTFLASGMIPPARALFIMQTLLQHDDPQPIEMVMQLNSTPNAPLLLKDDPAIKPCPADAPWKGEFDEALQAIGKMQWQQSADRLTALAAKVPDSPVVWHNLATLRSWLGDMNGCVEAWHKFATLNVPEEDAAEAEALAMILSDNPFGDQEEIQVVSYAIGDAEEVRSAIATSPRALPIPPDRLPQMAEDAPPPKAAFLLIDRPPLQSGQEATVEQVPRAMAHLLLYGRETDRSARIEALVISARRAESVQALVADLVPELRDVTPTTRVIGRVSASRQMLRRDWHLPNDLSPDQALRLADQFTSHVLLQQWPTMPLGLFDGKSPRDAAAEPACRIRLMAAILLIEFWTEQTGETFDFNTLRHELGLAPLEPIDPQKVDVDQLPLGRLARLEVEKLDDEALLRVYHRAMSFRAAAALEKLSHAMADRPALANRREMIPAYRYLAETAHDASQALDYIERGRKVTLDTNDSCASWDFLEVSVRLERGEVDQFRRLVNHIQSQHIREPGVAQALQRMLVELGIIRPDGAPAPAQEPSIVVPGAEGGEGAGKLWTPDSPGPTGQQSKIWTPD